MKSNRTGLWIVAVAAGLLTAQMARADATDQNRQPAEANSPRIQLAILLDTSGSMQGLINQARSQLWKIVNELATAKQDGKEPNLEVALYEYGNNGIPKSQGYLRKIVSLTDDLDKISEELFVLRTNGGQEYCGQVIAAATNELRWSESHGDLKLIFIAGNEPFSQGTVNYQVACKAAIAKGITVNTIFCGPEAVGIRTGWKHGAQLADGSFLNIDQNRKVADIRTPFDQKLAQLSAQVNTTYVAFGKAPARARFLGRQLAQDAAAKQAAPAAAAERAAFKGSKLYRASAWDLIDALKNGKVKLETVKDTELPKAMQKMSPQQRKEFLKKKQQQRAEIQNEIRKLSEQRKKYIAAERKKQSVSGNGKNDSLDAAIIQTVRDQASKKRFHFCEN